MAVAYHTVWLLTGSWFLTFGIPREGKMASEKSWHKQKGFLFQK